MSAWAGWLELLPNDVRPPAPAELAARVREAIDSDEVEVAVVEVDGVIAGRATFGSSRDRDAGTAVGELRSLQVDPRYRREGIGRALVEHALSRLRAGGRREATLWSLAASDQATAFYAAQDFVPDGYTQRRPAFGDALERRWRRGLDGG